MGKAEILEHLGKGQYRIDVDRAGDLVQKKIDEIDNKLATATELLRITSLEKRKEQLQKLLKTEEKTTWCADLSVFLSNTVDVIEINNEPSNLLLAPASPGHQTLSPGMITPLLVQTPSQALHSFSLKPGWQKFEPTYRIGEITTINNTANTCDISLDEATSPITGANINQSSSLSDVPIDYMTCNSAAFQTGDRVVVEFKNQEWESPHVIGFESNPRGCYSILLIFTNEDESKAFVWDIYNDSLFLPVASLSKIQEQLESIGYTLTATSTNNVPETFEVPTATTHTHAGDYNQPTYIEGTYEGMEYDFVASFPVAADLTYIDTDDDGTLDAHKWEWDFQYITAPSALQNAIDSIHKGGSLVHLKRFPDYEDTAKKDEFAELTGCDEWFDNVWIRPYQDTCAAGNCPYAQERIYYYYQSIFGIPPGYAIYEDLETTAVQLIDSWADVDGGGLNGCDGDPFTVDSILGGADTDNLSVVCECVQACDNVPDSDLDNGCEDANMRDRRVFRVFVHKKDSLSDLPLNTVNEINDYRKENGEDPLKENIGLLKAATRHAKDAAGNEFTGDTGSDGSTIEDRLRDAGYYLFVQEEHLIVSKDQLMEAGENLTTDDFMANWKTDPDKSEVLLNSDLREISAAVEIGNDSKDYLVVVFGGVPYRWPGYCPVDNITIDDYLFDQFDDALKLPNIYST